MSKILVIFTLILFLSLNTYAQGNNQGQAPKGGPKSQVSKIFLAGLGGAVLGLSTLSFHGKPQAHLENIAFGFAFGVLFGAIFTTYDTAKDPQQLYSDEFRLPPEITTQRKNNELKPTHTLVGYSWSY